MPNGNAKSSEKYLSGFRNYFESEALAGTLPIGQSSPQKVAHGLYAEQLSGSSFTMSRPLNLRSWLYRIQPSSVHGKFRQIQLPLWQTHLPAAEVAVDPNQMRWSPLELPKEPTDFIQGVRTYVVSGSAQGRTGTSAHLYACNQSMGDKYFLNADGELLILPQLGGLRIKTEFGVLEVEPLEIALIPRGVKFQVDLTGSQARGYLLENFGSPLTIPDLGPIGSNGSALPRDFLSPVAAYEQKKSARLIQKFLGSFWEAELDHSPLDVVAWHGNYAPFKYDLKKFQAIGTISFDHPDPSIWTVLTSPSAQPGLANADFVIFPPRWLVAENTFRPPYFHRNVMSEFMGLIEGVYDAKQEGFQPGGASLHNCMSAHGPDAATFEKASKVELKPQHVKDTMAFMLEGQYAYTPTEFSLKSPQFQKDYLACWSDLKAHFKK